VDLRHRLLASVRRLLPFLLAALLGAAAGIGAFAGLGGEGSTTTVVREVATAPPATSAPTAPEGGLSPAEIYRRAAPGVVEISTLGGIAGSGSGFVLDGSGLIVTNAHVVDGASTVTVQLASGRQLDGRVVGSDPSSDIALLRVEAPRQELHPLPLGDSAAVAVGDPVVAIGNPLGLERSLTAGVVSGLNRTIDSPSGATIAGAIQTDASLNPGSSGGPLLDAQGRVIGVNAQIAPGGNPGIGYAIPVNTVRRVVADLKAGRTPARAYMGVRIEQALGGGARVVEVVPGSPAARAGLRVDDVVLAADGRDIRSSDELPALVAERSPGQKLALRVRRDGRILQITVTLGRAPS
jgi:S1-C subfamily serine protease